MNIKYAGPVRDFSGYGEASRHHVAAFRAAGVNVVLEPLSYTRDSSDYGELGQMLEGLPLEGEYDIKVLHSTPDEFRRLVEPDKYNIGFMYWETDRIPEQFADALELVDEVWTGSEAGKSAIENAGVKTPVFVVPQPIETEREWPKPYKISQFEGYLFYSIFEWTDRKNPEALLKAYLSEFKANEKVGLVLKTYFVNFTGSHKRLIRTAIRKIKAELAQESYPQIFIYLDLMDRSQIMRLHATGDCFVSAHRGEGWGIPQVEAAVFGNPVISTDFGGCHEYFEDDENMFKVPAEMVPVSGMNHSPAWYTPEQNWADVSISGLRSAMRSACQDKDVTKRIAAKGQQKVEEKFNLKTVGNLMADRLKLVNKDQRS